MWKLNSTRWHAACQRNGGDEERGITVELPEEFRYFARCAFEMAIDGCQVDVAIRRSMVSSAPRWVEVPVPPAHGALPPWR
jgi:hypothetical protein